MKERAGASNRGVTLVKAAGGGVVTTGRPTICTWLFSLERFLVGLWRSFGGNRFTMVLSRVMWLARPAREWGRALVIAVSTELARRHGERAVIMYLEHESVALLWFSN